MEDLPYWYSSSPAAIDQYFKDQDSNIRLWFSRVRDMANDQNLIELKTETFSGVESIVGCIIDYAIKENIDLIVIGTKGRTGFKRFLMGSVANGVVQHAHCPVLLVR